MTTSSAKQLESARTSAPCRIEIGPFPNARNACVPMNWSYHMGHARRSQPNYKGLPCTQRQHQFFPDAFVHLFQAQRLFTFVA